MSEQRLCDYPGCGRSAVAGSNRSIILEETISRYCEMHIQTCFGLSVPETHPERPPLPKPEAPWIQPKSEQMAKVKFPSGAVSTKMPRFDLIPYEALVKLSNRIELELEGHGDGHGEGAWNPLSTNQAALTDLEFVIARVSRIIDHCMKLVRKLRKVMPNDGGDGDDGDDNDDHTGAIIWGGAFLCCMEKAMKEKQPVRMEKPELPIEMPPIETPLLGRENCLVGNHDWTRLCLSQTGSIGEHLFHCERFVACKVCGIRVELAQFIGKIDANYRRFKPCGCPECGSGPCRFDAALYAAEIDYLKELYTQNTQKVQAVHPSGAVDGKKEGR